MKFVFVSHGLPDNFSQKLSDLVGKPAADIRVLYITTPQNTYPSDARWILEAKSDLENTGFEITEYDIEGKSDKEVREKVENCDIFWVSGGNTFYFLYWANKVNLKVILISFLKQGGVYAGESAGVVCQIKDLEPIKWADNPEKAPEVVKEGMGLTDIIVLPHWGNNRYKDVMEKVKTYYEKKGENPYLLRDGEVTFVNGKKLETFK